MKQKILLITGWGGGTKLLNSFKNSLESKGFEVHLMNIFNALDPHELEKNVEFAKTFDVMIGWSLGGQLATILVDQIQQKYHEQKILITIASNPCFVANENWQTAMPQATFQSFKASFEHDAIATLKKFGYMVCQGVSTSKVDFISLQSLIQPQPLNLLKQGLAMLEQLNLVNILENYSGKQYHIFSEQDVLVDRKVAQYLQQIPAKFLEIENIEGSHGLPVFKFDLLTDKICHYLEKNN